MMRCLRGQGKPLCNLHFVMATNSPHIAMASNSKTYFSLLIRGSCTLTIAAVDYGSPAGLLSTRPIVPESEADKKPWARSTVLMAVAESQGLS